MALRKSALLKEMIAHYENVIETLPTIMEDVCRYTQVNQVDLGICKCAAFRFGTDIYKVRWTKKYANKGIGICGYWGYVPCNSINETREQVTDCLQLRVDIMKKILNEKLEKKK